MQRYGLVITCPHNDPSRIVTTEDGESVCRCGVVLEERIPDRSCVPSESRPMLYHQVESGGDPGDMKVINPNIHISNPRNSSDFSNICSKLGLVEHIRHRAWNIYDTLHARTHHARAKCAAFAIYVACRESGQFVPEADVQEAISVILCVRKTPPMLGVISEMHEDAMRLGVDTNEGYSVEYRLNREMSSRRKHFKDDPDGYDRFKNRVLRNFAMLENRTNRAVKAVRLTVSEMGVR